MQAVPAFHNGFLTGYKPAPIHYRPLLTNIVRMAACLILLASVSMQSYAPPAPAIDYTLSQHQKPRSTTGMLLIDMTTEELEDELMASYELQTQSTKTIEKELKKQEEFALYIEDLQIIIKGREAKQHQ